MRVCVSCNSRRKVERKGLLGARKRNVRAAGCVWKKFAYSQSKILNQLLTK